MADDTDGSSEQSWSDKQRELAAATAHMADASDALAERLRAFDNEFIRTFAAEAGVPTPAELAEMAAVQAYRLRTTQRLVAEQARNYDAFVAAGGQDNPDAYRAWRESCEHNAALMPTDYHTDLGT